MARSHFTIESKKKKGKKSYIYIHMKKIKPVFGIINGSMTIEQFLCNFALDF